ncbi:MAG: TolB-like 6-bladed beta-propeller domain-containing protein [Staphylococcus sp.]|nr:TolB-like 6-bladed beta-propeller domain-containing protein [Staphylococcus sp.]
MKIKFILLAMSVLCLTGCGSSEKSRGKLVITDFPTITGREILQDADLLRPQALYTLNDGLLVYNIGDSCFLSYFQDIHSPESKQMMGRMGQGPLEFLNMRNIYYNPLSEELFIYDSATRNAHVFNVAGGKVRLDSTNLISRKDLRHLMGYEMLPMGGDYITNGVFGHHLLGLVDPNGDIKISFGEFPGDTTNISNPRSFNMINQSGIIVNPQNSRLLVAGRFNDWLAFYDIGIENPSLLKEYFSHETKARTIQSDDVTTLELDDNCVETYTWLSATEDNVYILYDGRTIAESNEDVVKPMTILKFDWDGNLKGGYRIEDMVFSFSVTNDNRILYGLINDDGEYIIKKYVLNT